MPSTSDQIIRYIAETGGFFKGIKDLERINRAAAQQMGKDFSRVTEIISSKIDNISRRKITIDGKQAIQTATQYSTVVKTADGRLKTFTDTVKSTNGAVDSHTSALKDGAANARTFGDNIKRLAERALLTIPIWFAIRGSISGLTRTFRDGIKDIISFDAALQKARRNLQGTPEEVGQNFETLRKRVRELSLETGVSVEKITDAFQKFATVGFNFEDALAGAINSTKLSVTLFGDAEETADAFARALRVLIDRSEGAANSQQQIAEAMALTSELWKENQFDIREVNESLEKFAPAARSANISMKQTLTLLATLGTGAVGGARGGTLLRTSIQKLVENLDEASKILGIKFNPAVDDTYTVLLQAVDAMSKLDSNSKIAIERQNALSKIFGGVRGSLPISAFVALNDLLQKNSLITADVAKFNKDVDQVLQTVHGQARILGNALREVGKEFVSATIGGESFAETLERMAEGVKNLEPSLRGLGVTLNTIFRNFGIIAGTGFLLLLNKQISRGIPTIFTKLAGFFSIQGITSGKIFGLGFVKSAGATISTALGAGLGIKAILATVFSAVAVPLAVFGAIGKVIADTITNNWIDRTKQNQKKMEDEHVRIVQGIKKKLSKEELDALIIDINDGNIKLDPELAANIIKQLKEQVEKEFDTEGNRIEIKGKVTLTPTESSDIAESIIQDQLTRLRSQKALNSEVTKYEMSLKRQFKEEGSLNDQVKLRLRLKREESEEQRLQNRLSSDSMKLFEIAQTEGVEVARRIGEVLSGETDFDLFFKKGGRELEVFKEQFQDIFKSQQAERFFKGVTVPGLQELQGGMRIPIEEESLRNTESAIRASIENSLAESFALDIKSKSQEDNTGAINKNIEALDKNTKAIENFINNVPVGRDMTPVNRVTTDTFLGVERALDRLEAGTFQSQQSFSPFELTRLLEGTPQAKRFVSQQQEFRIDINLEGRNIRLEGTAEELKNLASNIAPELAVKIEEIISRNLTQNPQSNISKGVRQVFLDI